MIGPSHRFKLDETTIKRAKLDVFVIKTSITQSFCIYWNFYRSVLPNQLVVPDFLGGGRLHLLFEEWDYAWTPHVEAHWLELSELGSDLNTVAVQKLLQLKERLFSVRTGTIFTSCVQLFNSCSIDGIVQTHSQFFLPKFNNFYRMILIWTGHSMWAKLLNLWTGKDFLAFQQQPELKRCLPTSDSKCFVFAFHNWQHRQQINSSRFSIKVLQLRNLSNKFSVVVVRFIF